MKAKYSKDIVYKEYENEWWSYMVLINLEFGFDKHPQILSDLRNCVRRYIPADELEYCERSWAELEPEILVEGIQWNEKSLKKIQAFLNELNSIIKPIKNEVKAHPEGEWYQLDPPFAIATWEWTDDGFMIVGTEL